MAGRAVLTGLNGTVAPLVKEVLERQGFEVIKFDREKVDNSSEDSMRAFLDQVQPTHLYHIASNGPMTWPGFLAKYAYEHQIVFVFTSSEIVFSDKKNGPYTVDMPADKDPKDFGGDKLVFENDIRSVNPKAYICRLGWQLGDSFEGNTILAFLQKTHEEQGRIEASSKWIPTTSFIKDTAEFLYRIPKEMEPGIYHLNGNPGISFFEIAKLVNDKYQKGWTIVETDKPIRDSRLLDPRVKMPMITEHLQERSHHQVGGA